MVVCRCNLFYKSTSKQVDKVQVNKYTGMDKNIYAAIAMALYEYQGNNVHDKEPGFITIQPRQTMWNAKFLSLTAKP